MAPEAGSIYSAVQRAVDNNDHSDQSHLLFNIAHRRTAQEEYDLNDRKRQNLEAGEVPLWDEAARKKAKRERKAQERLDEQRQKQVRRKAEQAAEKAAEETVQQKEVQELDEMLTNAFEVSDEVAPAQEQTTFTASVDAGTVSAAEQTPFTAFLDLGGHSATDQLPVATVFGPSIYSAAEVALATASFGPSHVPEPQIDWDGLFGTGSPSGDLELDTFNHIFGGAELDDAVRDAERTANLLDLEELLNPSIWQDERNLQDQ